MDWVIPLITAGAALGGSTIGIAGLIAAQRIAQRNENARHARRLAYEAAIAAWREYRDTFQRAVHKNASGTDVEDEIQPLEDFLVSHLAFADATFRGIRSDSGLADIESILRTTRKRSRFLRELRDQLINERM